MFTLPTLFLSHGSPDLPLRTGSPVVSFFGRLGGELPRPLGILVISAHWQTPMPVVSGAEHPETIHDFFGFAPELYQMRYPVSGSPALAQRVATLLQAAPHLPLKLPVKVHPQRGLDHGAWGPLMLIYPEATIPVVQLSIQGDRDPWYHIALGHALAPLRQEGVLVVGSGSITHNLGAWIPHQHSVPGWVSAFDEWVADQVSAANWAALLDFQHQAPYAQRNHPTIEHLLPLFVALGAAGSPVRGERLHHSISDGVLSMAAFAFKGL